MTILPNGDRQNSAPQKDVTPSEDRPAASLRIDFYRVPHTPHLARLKWELITPAADYHKRRKAAAQFLAIVYDLNVHILQALAADFEREQNESDGGVS